MLLVRRIAAVLLGVAAVAVWFGMRPSAASPTADFASKIDSAMADYKVNNSSTSSAPQQQVVNGWAAKDLLEVIARAQNAALSPQSSPRDDRVPAELMLCVLGLAVLALTTPRPKNPAGVTTASAPAGPVQPVLSPDPPTFATPS
jgi:hypothetical protein